MLGLGDQGERDNAAGGVGVGRVEDGFGTQHRVELVRDVFQLGGDLLEAEAQFLDGAGVVAGFGGGDAVGERAQLGEQGG